MQIEIGTWVKGQNPFVDSGIFEGQMPKARYGYPFFTVVGEFIETPQDFTDVRSLVESDYQEILEAEWNTYLSNKYKVEINSSILK